MAKLTKRMRVIRDKVDATKQYDITEAVALLKELATAKFVKALTLPLTSASTLVNLTKTFVALPFCHTAPVVPFALPYLPKGANAEAAKAAGAETGRYGRSG